MIPATGDGAGRWRLIFGIASQSLILGIDLNMDFSLLNA